MRIDNNLNQYEQGINKAAEDIATNGIDNIENDMVDLIENKTGFKANLVVMDVENELLGTLLDIKV